MQGSLVATALKGGDAYGLAVDLASLARPRGSVDWTPIGERARGRAVVFKHPARHVVGLASSRGYEDGEIRIAPLFPVSVRQRFARKVSRMENPLLRLGWVVARSDGAFEASAGQ